jgi:tetratricopeptide (TPR) repeat protein
VLFHLSHGLVAFGVAYALSSTAALWWHAAPGSRQSWLALAGVVALGIFEVAFVAYVLLRRRRMRSLWKDAEALTRARRFDEAREALLQLSAYLEHQMRPENVLISLARVSEAMGDSREAIKLYRQAGDDPAALINLGVLLLEQGLNERAAAAFRRFMALAPGEQTVPVMHAIALYRAGKRDAAMSTLQARLAKRPNALLLKRNVERLARGEEPSLQVRDTGKPES